MTVNLSKRTVKALADTIIAELSKSYDLVYVDRNDGLTDKQKACLVSGDMDSFWEESDDWEGESRYSSVQQIIKDDAETITRRWSREDDEDWTHLADELDELTDEWDRVRWAIEERDSGDWVKDLVNNSGDVLLRINVLDEDNGYSFEDVKPTRVLADVGLKRNQYNIKVMRDTLAECSPEFSVLLGYWIVGASLSDLYDLPHDCEEVEIVDPYLYLGNPFAGSGWISEEPFKGTVRVKRSELRTDQDAFGYSVNEVFGGLSASSFQCDIKAVPKAAA